MESNKTTIDLHTHSTASDGELSPTELVRQAAYLGVKVLSLTDHDTTHGVAEAMAAAKRYRVELIPGIEINTDHEAGSLDILGYWVPIEPGPFQTKITELREGRVTRGQRMVERLTALGVPVQWERVRQLAQGAVGRPHIARALIEAGYATTISDAFDRYIGFGKPAYIPRVRFTAIEAVRFIRDHGGLPVMAHPIPAHAQHLDPFRLEELLPQFKAAGLVGMEAYYGAYATDTVRRMVALAERLDLIPTGGSDFHGPDNGGRLGGSGVPLESYERLKFLRGNEP